MKLLGTLLLTIAACTACAACAESEKTSDQTCAALGGVKVSGVCACPPGTLQIDGACKAVGSGSADGGAAAQTDGASSGPSDAARSDAAQPEPSAADAALTDAALADAAWDASSGAGDDASRPGQNDAAVTGGGDAGSACPIQNARFGCGTAVSGNWVVFQSGVEIDRAYHLAWSPPFEFIGTASLGATCDALVLGGIDDWDVPEIVDVRTMAAGCEGTTTYLDGMPNSTQCSVRDGYNNPTSTGECSCTTTTSPRVDGLDCRVDVPTCVTTWTKTACGDTCAGPEGWFYVVETGAIVLADSQAAVAKSAKARCVTYIPEGMLP